ncbi:Laminin subunit beta-4 [Saguinus oedipus]|uniref:Laminin subunit beta-4 n=1 Tax=Saguinus oedipus TaxID=9490 RepID=A0ABQ9UI08_SAGOE|nr:Laminin subunit beta-4 [Saguinus oedipus]
MQRQGPGKPHGQGKAGRKQIMQLNEQLKAVYEFQDLKDTIERAKNEADLLLEDLQEEIDLQSSVLNASIVDSSENIKKYYHISSSAEKKINETGSTINASANTRNDLLTILDTLTSKGNLSLEKLKQIKIPNIQILNEKVCGDPGNVPCVLLPCGGALCTGQEGHRRCEGPGCHGSLTVSTNALQKAQEAKSMIRNLDKQVYGIKNQKEEECQKRLRENSQESIVTEDGLQRDIKNISKLAEVSKNNALQLREKLGNVKNQSDSEEEKISLFIKKVKNFLLEENVPPEDIEKVANSVLDIHLPIPSQNLIDELDKIRKLLQLCEDYRTDENRLNKEADGAQKLLVKAKAAEPSAERTSEKYLPRESCSIQMKLPSDSSVSKLRAELSVEVPQEAG